MIKILFKRLTPDAVPPKRAHEGDAGWDITATTYRFYDKNTLMFGTGLAFAVPKGYWLDARARSSVYKTGLALSNGVGTIDSSYRGEVGAVFYIVNEEGSFYKQGDRIFQVVPMPCKADEVEFVEVDELPASWDGRVEGGFGSTGNK